jgi:carbon storage regulator
MANIHTLLARRETGPPTHVRWATQGFDRQGGGAMLVLTRKSNQSIMIGDEIEVSVLSIMGEKVRIGIQAPRDIPVFRKEVYLEIQQENMAAGASARAEVDDALKRLSSRP